MSKRNRKGLRHPLTGVALAVMLCMAPWQAGQAQEAAGDTLWERDTLTGDWGGSRSSISESGVDIGLEYIGEGMHVSSGGIKTGTTYEGRVELSLDFDFGKLLNWENGTAHISIFNIHNANNRNAADYVGSLSDPSNIDALRTNRLFTAWVQQDFGMGSFRIGQLAADDEFLTSDTAGGLINGTFGWANLMSANLPSGGAAYPLATPGARLQLNFGSEVAMLVGVFAGDPAGKDCYRDDPDANPQRCNRHGLEFSTSGGTFWIGELQYLVNQEEDASGLKGVYKLGAWYHTASFADMRYGLDANGAIVSLADPSVESDITHDGNYAIYGVIDQQVWRGEDASASVFVRGGFTPKNRNLVSWYIDGGVGITGLIPGRSNDVLTVGIGYTHISDDAADLDRDFLAIDGPPYPVRSEEVVYQLNYVAQITPWWTLQPNVQYISRPGGGVPDENNPAQRIGNAWIVGLRTTIAF